MTTRSVLDGLPGSPVKEAMDGVVFLGLCERDLIVGSVEAVAPVAEPVGPRNQRRAMCAVAHLVHGVGLQDVPIADPVVADTSANLDDRRPVVSSLKFELLS
jgi:hypothetical protein